MGATRFGRAGLATVGGGGSSRRPVGVLAVMSLGCLAALLVAILALAPARALAEPLCTDTWTGPSEGNWTTAADWSAGVPTSTSVACIGSGKTVTVTEGSNQVGVLEDKGGLALPGGSLEIVNALETSSTGGFAQSSGTLAGAGTLDVSESLVTFSGARMVGSGKTVILPGASATLIDQPEEGYKYMELSSERVLINEGTATLNAGSIVEGEGTKFENKGTLTANTEGGIEGASGTFINTGTFKKTEGEWNVTVYSKCENKGVVDNTATGPIHIAGGGSSGSGSEWHAGTGKEIAFTGGAFSFTGGTWVGTMTFSGASVTAEKVTATSAGVDLSAGTLSIPSGTVTVATYAQAGAELSGAGTLAVSESLVTFSGARMVGSGKTVILPGASATLIDQPEEGYKYMELASERVFINEGTATLNAGSIYENEGTKFENKGTLTANTEGGIEGASAIFVNTGTFRKTEGEWNVTIYAKFEDKGIVENTAAGPIHIAGGGSSGSGSEWHAGSGREIAFTSGSFTFTGGTWVGTMTFSGANITAEKVTATSAGVGLSGGTFTISSGTITVAGYTQAGHELNGAGNLDVSESLVTLSGSRMAGSGSTVVLPGATATLVGEPTEGYKYLELASGRVLINEGTAALGNALVLNEGAKLANIGNFKVRSNGGKIEGSTGHIVNTGVFETEGTGTAAIYPSFENLGRINEPAGKFEFHQPVINRESSTQWGGGESLAPGQTRACAGDPVSCATGNFAETQTDFAIGGRGVGLNLTRIYNSQAAAEEIKGAFGYGWTSSFSDHLVVNKTSKVTTLHQANGSTVPFTEETGGSFKAPVWTQDVLSGTEAGGYTLTLASQVKYKFAGASGRLESVTDRDGNATTLTYNESGQLTTITDPVSRKIALKYNGEGLVESAEDPMKHVVKYTYEGGNLKNVTQPAEVGLRWQFKYESHEMTEMLDGREGKTINEYNSSHQVTKQKDPAGHTLKFEYEPFHTKITNETTSSVTNEYFTSNDEPSSITRGYGTTSATTESFTYNEGGYVTSVTDGNEHTTKYGYSAANDRTSMVDPNKNETKWTYDSTHDVATMTTPKGETTTIKREAHGNPETIERPAPESKTQTTKYKYKTTGELESVEDPLKRITKYEYDTHGNRTVEIDPATDKRTWAYTEDSQETSTVSPRGHVKAGEEAKYTTTIERDAQGRPLKITDPLTHTTKYTYDGDGNVKTVTDGNSHTTTYTYNGDNQPVKVEAPNKAITETEYDGAGQVVSQTDGNKNVTKYKRNPVEGVTEVTDPLSRVTKKTYDAAGNLKTLEDSAKRTTTYKYDPANRLTEVSYSSGKPATITYEYDKDGDRTKMVDGTGTTKYTYDQLDRLTESENGHKEISKYEYDLANEQTKITYPNKKAVTRAFDTAGRLEKITDWSSNITKFTYNADSQQATTLFPTTTKDKDEYAYNEADQMTEAKMLKETELASLVYTRDNDGQLKKTTSKGLPGAEITENTYDENSRLTKSGSEYKYDSANNPTTIGAGTYKYNKASQLETGPSLTYTYDELGERTKTKPSSGPATTYGYDQAGNLTSVERPKEGEVAEIKDTYAYNGEGLRTSQTISGTTTNLAWDVTEGLPLILSDETNSYIYGPGGLPVEQVSSGGTVTYLHHDQQGSIRLLTGSAGTVTGKCTYGAYGTPTCEGTTTTPLGYDGQYTSSDTGLIYMRARVYDPATAQFLSVDPLRAITRAPYTYVKDNPLNLVDPSGLAWQVCVGGTVTFGFFTVEANACYVNTPGGEGLALSGGTAGGPGFAANVHAGVGGSNAQTPGEYGGPFATAGGSAQAGFGGYASGFVGPGGPCNVVVAGGTAGVSAGVGAEVGGGASYTEVIPF
jgi:RHS repeat-associated protein